MDLSRAEILNLARKAAAKHPGARIHFKFTCPKCGERCVLEEDSTLYERGICFNCGSDSPIEKAGFVLIGNASEFAEGGVR
jgi:transcription elongation factor Elf1